MSQYYYVGIVLPELSFDEPPELSFQELDQLLRDQLSSADYQKTRLIREYFDLLNLRALWLGQPWDMPWDVRGELTESEMEEAVLTRSGISQNIIDYLEDYTSKEDRLRHFPRLIAEFFRKAANSSDRFLRDYFQFERALRLVMTGYRAHTLKKDLALELQYEDPEDPMVAQLLAQRDSAHFVFPEGFEQLAVLFQNHAGDPMGLQRALDELQFDHLEKLLVGRDSFSVQRVLGYLIQWNLVEKWFAVDAKGGEDLVRNILNHRVTGRE